jgi:hypothetical protein
LPRARRRKIWRRQVRPPAIPAVGGVSSRDGRRGATAAFQPGGRRYGLGRAGRPAWPSMHPAASSPRSAAAPARAGGGGRSIGCHVLSPRAALHGPVPNPRSRAAAQGQACGVANSRLPTQHSSIAYPMHHCTVPPTRHGAASGLATSPVAPHRRRGSPHLATINHHHRSARLLLWLDSGSQATTHTVHIR